MYIQHALEYVKVWIDEVTIIKSWHGIAEEAWSRYSRHSFKSMDVSLYQLVV